MVNITLLNRIVLRFGEKMVDYKVTVSTGTPVNATTTNHIHIKLVGTDGESDRTRLSCITGPLAFMAGKVSQTYSTYLISLKI